MMASNPNTDEFLAVRFPHVHKSWLERVNQMLARLFQENGGYAEMHTKFQGTQPVWTEWQIRELFPRKEETR